MAYTYDPIFAADPNNPAVVAANAAILIYDPADTGKAPIAITDSSGSPLANPITVNKNGFGPAFQHPTIDRVAWQGGGFEGFFTSYEGMKNAALDAADAAQLAQAAAETAGVDAAAEAAAALAGAVADAEAAQAAAETAAALVGAPADSAVQTLISAPASATRAALNATYRNAADGGYLMACFRAASGALGGDQVLSLLYSKDGKTFYDGSYSPQYSPTAPKVVRDPSIIYRNGVFYICHTNTGASGTSFDIITSTDLYNWTLASTIDMSSIGSVTATWAPEFVTDTNGDVYIFVTINQQDPYWIKATNAGLTTWTAPTLLTITGRPSLVIDPVFVKKGSTWYCFYKREDASVSTNRLIYRATSSTLTGTYTTDKTGDWAGWGSNLEGPEVVTLHDGTYRIYLDEPNNTTDLFSYFYSDSTDLETWTAKVPVGRFPGDVAMKIRHGSVLPLTAEAGMKAASLAAPVASARFVGKLNNQNQIAAPGIYAGYGTNGANKYPDVIWANGTVAVRAEIGTTGDWALDLPGVASSTRLKVMADRTEFGGGVMPKAYTTATRPSVWGTGQAGTVIYDSTLGRDIMWSGNGWVSPDGENLAPSKAFVSAPLPIWQKAFAKTVAGEADSRILCVGDSTTSGIGAGTTSLKQGVPGSYPTQLAALITATGTPASPGMGIPPSSIAGTSDDRWTVGAGWAVSNYGWGGSSCWFAQTGIVTTLVYNPAGYGADATTYDSFDVYYLTNSTGPGTFNAQATGGSVVPVNAATGSGDVAKVTITAGSASSTNTVTITPVSGQAYIVGIEPFNSAVKRVRVANAGVPSSRTSHWITNNPGFGGIPAIKRYAPDLTIISLGINDSLLPATTTTYDSNLAQIITAAAVSGDVLLVAPFPSKAAFGAGAVQLERAYGAIMLATGKPYTDMRDALGTPGNPINALMYDNPHPNAAGYAKAASQLLQGIVRV